MCENEISTTASYLSHEKSEEVFEKVHECLLNVTSQTLQYGFIWFEELETVARQGC